MNNLKKNARVIENKLEYVINTKYIGICCLFAWCNTAIANDIEVIVDVVRVLLTLYISTIISNS